MPLTAGTNDHHQAKPTRRTPPPAPENAGDGTDLRQIATELARRYNLRSRTAWREAHGWSLRETAHQINIHTGDPGLDPTGICGMTGAHLSENETWPGYGPSPPAAASPLPAVPPRRLPQLRHHRPAPRPLTVWIAPRLPARYPQSAGNCRVCESVSNSG